MRVSQKSRLPSFQLTSSFHLAGTHTAEGCERLAVWHQYRGVCIRVLVSWWLLLWHNGVHPVARGIRAWYAVGALRCLL